MTASTTSQNELKCVDEHAKSCEGAKIVRDPKVLEAKKELKKLLQSQHDKSDVPTDFAAKRHLILCDDSGLKLIEMSNELQESLKCDKMDDLINQECFNKVSSSKYIYNYYPVYDNYITYTQHSAGVYYRSVKKLAYKHESHGTNNQPISSDFLCPLIEQVKVTWYGSETIIVVKGQKLWFVHSIRLPATLAAKEPFQAQEVSISFKAKVSDFNWKEDEVIILSHFSEPIAKKVCVESNVSCNLVK